MIAEKNRKRAEKAQVQQQQQQTEGLKDMIIKAYTMVNEMKDPIPQSSEAQQAFMLKELQLGEVLASKGNSKS